MIQYVIRMGNIESVSSPEYPDTGTLEEYARCFNCVVVEGKAPDGSVTHLVEYVIDNGKLCMSV